MGKARFLRVLSLSRADALRMLAMLTLAALAGCASQAPQQPQPAFYTDLAQPGTSLDPVTATEIINAYRARSGLGPYVWDASLKQQAEQEARGFAERGDLLEVGGNLGLRGQSGQSDLRRSVSGGYHSFADAFSGWRGSPSHDAVLKVAEGNRYAIAAVARPGSRHRVYWVVLVARR